MTPELKALNDAAYAALRKHSGPEESIVIKMALLWIASESDRLVDGYKAPEVLK